MITQSIRRITCTDSQKCSDTILKELETKLNKKLHKDKPTESKPDGSLSIYHEPNNHLIILEIY